MPSRGHPVRHLLQMSTKPVTTRATTATCTECVRRGLGHNTPFSGRGSRNAAEHDPRPNILQLNTEGLTANRDATVYRTTIHRMTIYRMTIYRTTVHGTTVYRTDSSLKRQFIERQFIE